METSINQLATLTGKNREHISGWISGLPYKDGPKGAKLYESVDALSRIYTRSTNEERAAKAEMAGDDTPPIDKVEADRILSVRRGDQIKLEMEVTARKRIPIDICAEVNNATFSNIAGMLKSQVGKEMTEGAVQDLLTELRSIATSLEKWSR